MLRRYKNLFIVFFAVLITPVILGAQESANYKVLTPTLSPGGYSSSASFSLNGAISQFTIGSSTSNLFKLFNGFEYFPFVSTPVVSATGGNAQVGLSWTTAAASNGWTVGNYAVGQSTASGGPYSFTDVGAVLSSTRTGLTNGTTYYFVIQVKDGLGNVIATSTQVSATPSAPSSPAGGGGGGGGGSSASGGDSQIVFSGRAYPRSTITLLKDAQVVTTTIADATASFRITLPSQPSGNYFFSLYSEDNKGNRSSLVTFPVSLTSGATTNINGIFIAPTIAVDKSEVRKGDNIAIFGQTSAVSEVTIQVNSDEPFFTKTKADNLGAYLANFDTSVLEYGEHSTKSKSAIGGEISSYSNAVGFRVGTANVFLALPEKKPTKKGDANGDGRVNLVDFSVVAYWYNRLNPPANADVNGDGRVNLIDFSILAYNWTG